MSAIAGVLFTDGRDVASETLAAIADAASARGPDGVTCWRDGPLGLVRVAHATTVEAVGEVQPFIARESGTLLLFDGRLDNREELIGMIGAVPPGTPDGRLALELFDRRGREFVHALAGDFAIVTWEPRARRLMLFRSAMGWRPLYWHVDCRAFAFATEARPILLGLGIERRLNEGMLAEYMSTRLASETESFWLGVERVPQGCATIFENGIVSHWAWHGGPFEDLSGVSMAEHVERFRALFDQALIATSRANGPVTSQLSGGLDSSTVVCRAAELHRSGRMGPVGAISARFPGEPHDESEWSRAVEAHAGITAEVAFAQPFVPEDARAWCAETWHMPIRPNVNDTLFGACAMLRADGRRVLLTGEGGDDWLNGSYSHWPDLLRRGQLGALLRQGAAQWPTARWDVIARRTLHLALMPLVSGRHRDAVVRPHLDFRLHAVDWLRPEWTRKVGLEDRLRQSVQRDGLDSFSTRSRYVNFTHGARYTLYEPVHAFTERQGIEFRHPFHDLRLTNFFMGVDAAHLRRFDTRKLLLREAMRGTLPEIVRERRTKAVFAPHTIDVMDRLFEERPPHELLPAKLGWIDADRIAALFAPMREWRRQGSKGPLPVMPLGPPWFAIATDMWLTHAFGLQD